LTCAAVAPRHCDSVAPFARLAWAACALTATSGCATAIGGGAIATAQVAGPLPVDPAQSAVDGCEAPDLDAERCLLGVAQKTSKGDVTFAAVAAALERRKADHPGDRRISCVLGQVYLLLNRLTEADQGLYNCLWAGRQNPQDPILPQGDAAADVASRKVGKTKVTVTYPSGLTWFRAIRRGGQTVALKNDNTEGSTEGAFDIWLEPVEWTIFARWVDRPKTEIQKKIVVDATDESLDLGKALTEANSPGPPPRRPPQTWTFSVQGGLEGTAIWAEPGGAGMLRFDVGLPLSALFFWALRAEGRYLHPKDSADRYAGSFGPEIGWRPCGAVDLSLFAGPSLWSVEMRPWGGMRTALTLEEIPDPWIGRDVTFGLWQGLSVEEFFSVPSSFTHTLVAASAGLSMSYMR